MEERMIGCKSEKTGTALWKLPPDLAEQILQDESEIRELIRGFPADEGEIRLIESVASDGTDETVRQVQSVMQTFFGLVAKASREKKPLYLISQGLIGIAEELFGPPPSAR
ncbi:MAG: hypothetical protein EXS51_01575 [Candidatus Taylorbacteria bacterium]|nr:hypothetical protein [Candidatus Taylorbacteria bacterium]